MCSRSSVFKKNISVILKGFQRYGRGDAERGVSARHTNTPVYLHPIYTHTYTPVTQAVRDPGKPSGLEQE